jgi:hypothetical protein
MFVNVYPIPVPKGLRENYGYEPKGREFDSLRARHFFPTQILRLRLQLQSS